MDPRWQREDAAARRTRGPPERRFRTCAVEAPPTTCEAEALNETGRGRATRRRSHAQRRSRSYHAPKAGPDPACRAVLDRTPGLSPARCRAWRPEERAAGPPQPRRSAEGHSPREPRGREAGCDAGLWDQGRQALDQLVRLEEDRPRVVVPGASHVEEDLPVGGERERILGNRGTQDVSDQVLKALAIACGHGDSRVEVEAAELSLALGDRSAKVESDLRSTCATISPARPPVAARPKTEAPKMPARSGDSLANSSIASIVAQFKLAWSSLFGRSRSIPRCLTSRSRGARG